MPSIGVVREIGLSLISKPRYDAALYLPFTGAKPPRDPTPRYGTKLKLRQLTQMMHLTEQLEGDYSLKIYQMQVYQKGYSELLNVVLIRKTQLKTGKVA